MHEFEIADDGLVREASIHRMVTRLKEHFGDIDETALEAHLMLELTHAVLADMRAASWSRLGLTGRRFTLLRLLYLAEGRRMSMGEVAANLNMGSNNTTQLIDGVVRDGLVERESGTDDRRVVYAVLTRRGAELFASAFPQNSQRIKDSWSPLSEREKRLLVHLMSRLRLHLLSGGDSALAGDAAPEGTQSGRPKRWQEDDPPPPISSLSQPNLK